MPLKIPVTTQYTIKEGDSGLAVFALQRTCNRFKFDVYEDLDFGPKTKKEVIALQNFIGVNADGVFGPLSQTALAKFLCTRRERIVGKQAYLPKHLLLSMINYESAGYIAAVNWNSPGGVDVGLTQRRVYTHQFNDDEIVKAGFDPAYQVALAQKQFSSLHKLYMSRPGCRGSKELAARFAVLSHNYPLAARKFSYEGTANLSNYWHQAQEWVTRVGVKFPDGAPVRTPFEWCQRYALGSQAHNEPGQVVKFVEKY